MDSSFAIPGDLTPQGLAAGKGALPKAKDMSHHLNRLALHRSPNALKELYQYASIPGMVPLAGGIPSPTVFPFETLSATVQSYDSLPLDPPRRPTPPKKGLFSWLFPEVAKTISFTIPKYVQDAKPTTVQLSTSLQYNAATGPPALPLFLREYVEKVYKPGYADWDVLINCGATDAWGKICFMLLERGDAILVEEFTYPGAENAFLPMETEMVAIKMDGQGAIPAHLDEVLGTWDEEKRGKRRPRVFYTIPTGQNPTGATMLGDRKKEIYDICCKYDVIICEDEPYYCLYTGKWSRAPTNALELQEGKAGQEAFLKALPPTFLRYDTEGRVIRMDTFSKTSCPGSRMGWFVSSPLFIERLTRATEASTQAPSGFASAMTTVMLQKWGFDGYIRWLRGIKATYRMRRDWMVDAFDETFHLDLDGEVGRFGKGITCYPKTKGLEKRKPLVSFIPPSGGMFIFLAIHLDQHPDYQAIARTGEDATRKLMEKLWRDLADHLILFAPGWAFDAHGPHNIGGEGVGYFRLSYSILSYEQTQNAIKTFAKVLEKFFRH